MLRRHAGINGALMFVPDRRFGAVTASTANRRTSRASTIKRAAGSPVATHGRGAIVPSHADTGRSENVGGYDTLESGSAMLSRDRFSASIPNLNSAAAAISIRTAATA